MTLKFKCPTCRQTIVYSEKNPDRPFCSERCRLIDLGQWFEEGYSIADDASAKDCEDSNKHECNGKDFL